MVREEELQDAQEGKARASDEKARHSETISDIERETAEEERREGDR